ncbi:hypothetical protein ACE6H2_000563 [Prunus campanulata]
MEPCLQTTLPASACGNESKSSKVAAVMHDGRPDLEEKADYLKMEVAVTSSFKIEPSSENLQSCTNNKLSGVLFIWS